MSDELTPGGSRSSGMHFGQAPEDLRDLSPDLLQDPKYEFLKLLGEGGMGQVFLGRRRGFNQLVAIKLVRVQNSGNASVTSRFRQEVSVLFELNHTHIARAYDFEQIRNTQTRVMEFIDGKNLLSFQQSAESQNKMIGINTVCNWMYQAAKGLQYAHEKNIVHRDIKPENLMLNQKNEVKIVNFGLAVLRDENAENRLTVTNSFMGSLQYMSPEQRRYVTP